MVPPADCRWVERVRPNHGRDLAASGATLLAEVAVADRSDRLDEAARPEAAANRERSTNLWHSTLIGIKAVIGDGGHEFCQAGRGAARRPCVDRRRDDDGIAI
jgi:hypothetical protein